ncbi:unnamed protein product [Ectocarpus sp. CCAP 1310/34]|nr:unnamed protein product [Ectocarpus sp. CCAP 1310/34]
MFSSSIIVFVLLSSVFLSFVSVTPNKITLITIVVAEIPTDWPWWKLFDQ